MGGLITLPGEILRYSGRANAMIVRSDYALPPIRGSSGLPLVAPGGTEAVGGRLYVTNLRVVFTAHAVNRLHGSLTIPLTAIEDIQPWRSKLNIGVEVTTGTTRQQYTTWGRSRVVGAIEDARRALGPAERAQIESVRESLRALGPNYPVETLSTEVRQLFNIGDTAPTLLELRSLSDFLSPDTQNDQPPADET